MRKRFIQPVPPLPATPAAPVPSGPEEGTPESGQAAVSGDETVVRSVIPPEALALRKDTAPKLDRVEDSPALVWPPPEDDLSGWEVLHLQSGGHTIIEPTRPTEPITAKGLTPEPTTDLTTPEPAPGIDDTIEPAIEVPPPAATLVFPTAFQRTGSSTPVPSPFHLETGDAALPETQVIEPMMLPAIERALDPLTKPGEPPTTPRATPYTPASPSSPGLKPSTTDFAWPTPTSGPQPAYWQDEPVAHEDTDPGLRTRILPAPPRFDPPRAPALFDPPRTGGAGAETPGSDAASVSGVGRRHDTAPGRVVDQPAEPRPSLVDTLPTGIKLSSLYPKGVPPAPPISAGDAVIHPAPPFPPSPTPAEDAGVSTRGGIPTPAPRAGLHFGSFGWRVVIGVLAVALLAQLAWMSYRTLRPSAGGVVPATLVVESSPAGATVLVDGHVAGTTPFRGEVPPGDHQLEVRSGDARRTLPIALQAGTLSSYTVELAAVAPPKEEAAPASAEIEIRSDPSGARVSVDGVARGTTPVVVSSLAPGRHQVQVSGPFRAVTRTVSVSPGQRALLVVTPARSNEGEGETTPPVRPAGGRGTFSIQSPLVLRIMRNGDFIGTSEDARIQMPAGTHDVSFENDAVGFRESRSIEVVAGRHVSIPVELPQGTLNINARPWAEVFVDGQKVGDTPIASLALPIGAHEIVYRHPNFPERRVTVIVRVGVAGRSFVDFTK
jgi:hypothetical protein